MTGPKKSEELREPFMEKAQFAKANALRRRYYIMVPLAKADQKKLRRWLDRKDDLEIAGDDNNSKILITNQTRIQATPKSRELFGIRKTEMNPQ